MSIDALGAPPADPTNKVADDPEAAAFGALLFADRQLSANGRVSCASCHDPARGFTDRHATGHGIGIGSRRTMPVAPAIYSAWQFWDGRADSLWAQALGPIENPAEHGFTRGQLADRVREKYAARYVRLFGALPQVMAGRASPLGDVNARARWNALGTAQQDAIDTVFANAGKAIAAFERRQRVPDTRFDRYLRWLQGGAAGTSPMSAEEIAGLRIFIGKGRCSTCHSGPLLTNNDFANSGVPDIRRDAGRIAGIATAQADPFNCRGRFNDAAHSNCDELDFAPRGDPAQAGAFKVPSLRGVAQRSPYMHAGQIKSLDAVVRHYVKAPAAAVGRSQLKPVALNAEEQRALLAFLNALGPQ